MFMLACQQSSVLLHDDMWHIAAEANHQAY